MVAAGAHAATSGNGAPLEATGTTTTASSAAATTSAMVAVPTVTVPPTAPPSTAPERNPTFLVWVSGGLTSEFVNGLEIGDDAKQRLLALTPQSYTGIASQLVDRRG